MKLKSFVVILFVSIVTCKEETKKADSVPSGSDFVQLSPFQLPPQRVFPGSADLTALPQTHVFGNFHHRFHPSRVEFNFGANPSQIVYTPQTHIIPPHQQEQRNFQHNSGLRSLGSQNEAQPSHFIHTQQAVNQHQNFKSLPSPQKGHLSFGSGQEQSIKNAFPSNAPHTIKFSISSQNYNPNQVKQYVNQGGPQPKINHQLTASLSPGRFIAGSQVPGQPSRQLINQVPSVNFQQQANQFNDPPKFEQNNFHNFNVQTKPSFGLGPVSGSGDASSQFNVNSVQSNAKFRAQQLNNEVPSGNFFGNKGAVESGGRNGFYIRPADPQPPLIQSSIELKQNDLLQQQGIQTNFQAQPSFAQSTPQYDFQYESLKQQTRFNRPLTQSTIEYRTTESPRVTPTEAIYRSKDPIKASSTAPPSTSTFSDARGRKLAYQKSQDQLQFAINGNFLTTHHSNEISPSSSSPTEGTFTTRTTVYKKPKPVVKEITINLNDHNILNKDVPTKIYIKENRQKEFEEIKEKNEKEQRRKNEKTQEELINEQIQKLLQSHNLEIIDKDNDTPTDSQEAQISKVSEQFKKYNYSVQLLNAGSLLSQGKQKQKSLPEPPPLPNLPDHIKKQYDIKLVHKDELFKQFSLPKDQDFGNTSSNVFLANGEQLQIVQFDKDGTMKQISVAKKSRLSEATTTAKPPKALFEELAKGVIPPGANFELIKHKGDGQVEKVDDLTGSKKVTFVFLEEQPDGSVKVQGIKGNAHDEEDETPDVDSLIKKIKDGSLKLPPSSKLKNEGLLTNEIPRASSTTDKTFVGYSTPLPTTVTSRPVQNSPSPAPNYEEKEAAEQGPTTEFTYSSPYSVDLDSPYISSSFYKTTPEPPTTFLPTLNYIRTSTRKPREKIRSRITFLPTVPTIDSTFTPTFGSRRLKSSTTSWAKNTGATRKPQKSNSAKTSQKHDDAEYTETELLSHRSTEYRGQRLRVPQDVIAQESTINAIRPLKEILKENGLNEMAKFLDQSGLDTILNETGPYTIFIPTDKAFKTLEAQLGGPDRADDKFRENPRLLSGLLLHHVVPGSFRVEDLQDEMTGVSLAGTQLRVNIYPHDDKRIKDTVVTINGAKVSNENKDIVVPQGLAHSVDRVLFPLPIGDILQTLKSDRERRFTKFLKSLEYSGLSDMLKSTKTYTVFAPTDKAFSVLTDSELDRLLTREEAAKTIALRHIIPGTLYTAGMNYFQVKDSMEEGQKIVIKKELGKIKANSAQIISANIPATNGVIHAVEALL